MNFYIFIIKRFLRLKTGFLITTLAIFSVFGIFLGDTALLLVTGVMEGLHDEIKSRVLALTPHIVIQKFFGKRIEDFEDIKAKISGIQGIEGVFPYKHVKTLFRVGEVIDGGVLRALPEGSFPVKKALKEGIVEGRFELKDKGIILGQGLAYKLKANIGDTVVLIVPSEEFSPLGLNIRSDKFVVKGIFDIGYYEYNSAFAFVSLDDYDRFLPSRLFSIEVVLRDPYLAEGVKKEIENRLSYPFFCVTWIDMNKTLFSALKLEKYAMFLILTIILFVASFLIMGSLYVLMTKKTRDIGILKSMGAENKTIFWIFLFEGIFLGTIGIFSGILTGSLLGYIANRFKIIKLPPDIYFIDYLPLKIEFSDILLTVFVTYVIVLFSSVFPALKASKILPRDALRYE